MSRSAIEKLEECRAEEKQQAHFYRALATAAEDIGDGTLSERFQELHADEQHHLSRLTARLLELGHPAPDPLHRPPPVSTLEAWMEVARLREQEEVHRYEVLLGLVLDDATRMLAEQILEVERLHERELGGKWTMA